MITAKLLAPLVATATVLAGCGGSGGSAAAPPMAQDSQTDATSQPAPSASTAAALRAATVTIKSFQFGPATTVVKRGGRVTWQNRDTAQHTSTADDRSFDTQTIDIGSSRAVTFTTAGTFHYHCDFHPFMKGTVIVR